MTDKQGKIIVSISILVIVLVGLIVARSMIEDSSLPENYRKLVFFGIFVMAIVGLTAVWSRK